MQFTLSPTHSLTLCSVIHAFSLQNFTSSSPHFNSKQRSKPFPLHHEKTFSPHEERKINYIFLGENFFNNVKNCSTNGKVLIKKNDERIFLTAFKIDKRELTFEYLRTNSV